MIKLNLKHSTISDLKINSFKKEVDQIINSINSESCTGKEWLGWDKWPETYDKNEFTQIEKLAKKWKGKFNVLVVVGIGGSYLGAKAAIEYVKGMIPQKDVEIIFVGNTFSPTYTAQVLNYIKDKDVLVNVISKSGTTTETAIAFRMIEKFMISKYSTNAKQRIIATTDAKNGALKELANSAGYDTFTIPSNIGGRFSVLTAVGLVPMALAGIDISKVMAGAKIAMQELANPLKKNDAARYAVARYLLGQKYRAEMMVSYEPQMASINEWWKQLYGESEGKGKKGLLPTSAIFSTDLHSLGQFVQDGSPVLFETIQLVKKPTLDVMIPKDDKNLDGLNYLASKNLSFVNEKAFEGTLTAHVKEGKVPNIIIELESFDETVLGYYFYFHMKACAISALMLEVNPFDQPGVEVYKKNMFKLLGK